MPYVVKVTVVIVVALVLDSGMWYAQRFLLYFVLLYCNLGRIFIRYVAHSVGALQSEPEVIILTVLRNNKPEFPEKTATHRLDILFIHLPLTFTGA